MDIVYPILIDSQNDTEELRYSLRSLSNIPHGTVYIVGDKPEWLRNVVHIPVLQNSSKYENVRRNILTAIQHDAISNDFIFMNDDFFIMRSIDKIPTLHYGDMVKLIDRYYDRYPDGSTYISAMSQTRTLLHQKGIERPLSYELHVPLVVNKYQADELLGGVVDASIHFRSMYGNTFEIGGEQIEDVKLFLDPSHNNEAYRENPTAYMESQLFLSATGGAFKRGKPGEFIRLKFPHASRYEA